MSFSALIFILLLPYSFFLSLLPKQPVIIKPAHALSANALPSPKPTATPTPIPTQTPIPTIVPTAVPTPAPTPQNFDLKVQFFIDKINQYRNSQGLSSIKPDSYTCSFAKIRASEIVGNFSHDGFHSRINNNSMPYPGFTFITENIEQNEDPSDVINWWINSPGHASNLRANATYACVESFNDYYAYESWLP